MCWSPKVKTPAVSAQIAAPAPQIMDTAKGVQFGDEDTGSKKDSKEQSGIKGLTITPNTENSNSESKSTTFGSTATGANTGSSPTGIAGSAVKKMLTSSTTKKSKGGA